MAVCWDPVVPNDEFPFWGKGDLTAAFLNPLSQGNVILQLSYIQDGVSCIGQIASLLSKTGPVKPYGGLDLDQYCLMAPSHYLNQCCLLISEVLWHSPENQATILYNEFENDILINTVTSPNSQCVDICHSVEMGLYSTHWDLMIHVWTNNVSLVLWQQRLVKCESN